MKIPHSLRINAPIVVVLCAWALGMAGLLCVAAGEPRQYCVEDFAPTKEYREVTGGWLLSYDGSRRVCAYTVEKLGPRSGKGPARRDSVKFHKDPFVPDEFSSDPDDYNGFTTEYDRGHCAGAQNHNESDNHLHETFTIANTMPQAKGVNERIWLRLEQHVLSIAQGGDTVWVTTFPVWAPDGYPKSWEDREAKFTARSIGLQHQHVPPYCGKSILVEHGAHIEIHSWLVPNDERVADDEYTDYAIDTDSLEKLAGYDLWHGLPDELEAKLEAVK